MTTAAGTDSASRGWLVIDPSGRPNAWYGSALADDAEATVALLEPDPALRARMRAGGWSVRAGNPAELIGPGGARRPAAASC